VAFSLLTLDDMAEWQRIVLTGAAAAAATIRHIRITAIDKAHLWASAKQQEEGATASGIIKADGSTGTIGAETLVHLDAGAIRLVARMRGLKGPGTGDLVGVRVDQARVHLFDGAGARLG